MLQDIRMRRNIDMKKKIIIPLSIIVIVFLVANIVTYAYSNENLFEFFFADNNAVQKKITNNLLTRENQKIEIDNYIINLKESLCEKKTQLGYLVISVSDKNGNKVDADIDKKNNTIKSFGEDNRFTFEYEATGTFTKYAEYKENKLYIYVSFEINNEIWQDTDLNKCIKITDTAKRINKKYKQYNFDLKFAENCKKFKSKDGVLYLSPLGLRFLTDTTMDELVIAIKDENDKTINSFSNSDNMLSESGKRYKDITKVQYAAEFDELLDIKKINNIYINENKLEEVK